MQNVESVGNLPVMENDRSDARLIDMASMKLGLMPGLIERYNGLHVVSLTANLHGISLGEAARGSNERSDRRVIRLRV
jgi:multidrug efflux pump subunit AcrB